ncbi:MAG: O-acetyl-ADP-ribose deacetylase (regulator of RNase III) [Chlamydiales bacterium]|jgi:O-acetyl-ADP-ribose deacetylase (regulator of RNase III)
MSSSPGLLQDLSAGVYGYPADEAAAIAVRVAREDWDLDEVRLMLLGERLLAVWQAAFKES